MLSAARSARPAPLGEKPQQAATDLQSHRVKRHLQDFRQALQPAQGAAEVAALDEALTPLLSAA